MKVFNFVLLLFMSSLCFGQLNTTKIDSLLMSLNSQKKFNGTVLIANKGKIAYLKSIGLANETTKAPLDKNAIFDLASVSKQFTATAIMILKERNELQLNDPLTKYIPELSFYNNITIKNLLNHTSGLPDYMRVLMPYVNATQKTTNAHVITLYSKHKPALKFTPGTVYEYSNTGYVLLASVIERVSGMSYATFLKRYIFNPLNMNRTFVNTYKSTPTNLKNITLGYMYDRKEKRYVLPKQLKKLQAMFGWIATYGDGAIHSTVIDLLKWDRALYTTKILPKESIKAMFTPTYHREKFLKDYGYGWSIKKNTTMGTFVRHGGGWPGYVTEFERHIDNDKTLIVLQNHYGTERPIKWLRNIIYSEPLPKTASQWYATGKSVSEIINLG